MAAVSAKIAGNLDLPELRKHLEKFGLNISPGVKVGVLDAATYEEGPAQGKYVAQVLAHHEFGTSKVPPRAPLRGTMLQKQSDWIKEFKDTLKTTQDAETALKVMGENAASDIRTAIDAGLSPALAESTVELKRRMTREGKLLPKGELGDYATDAETPVMLTGTARDQIKSKYFDEIGAEGE